MAVAPEPTFETVFGRPPDGRGFAPGRVNLMGDHTDYNGGWVLPMVLERKTRVELALRDDHRVRVVSDHAAGEPSEYALGREAKTGGWLDYVQGVTAVLADEKHVLGGFDLRLTSDLPAGAGLASSAALTVAVLRTLRLALSLSLDDLALARLAQRAENDFVGAPVGVMDPLVISVGNEGEALLIDTRDLSRRAIPLPPWLDVLVLDSGLRHQNREGGYAERRQECEAAARALGVASLRDADGPAALAAPLAGRVRHVLGENARARACADALERGDRAELGRAFRASHESLRHDFQSSLPAIDTLVELASNEPGVIGARMTGAGFGGAVIVLAEVGTGALAADRIIRAYRARTGAAGAVLVGGA
jgi:galactokinase